MKIPTCVIERNGAPLIINKSDFRYGSDKLWDAEAVPEVVAIMTTTPEPPADVKISHKGAGRWVVTVNGTQVHEGFLTKKQAEAVALDY